MKPSRKIQAWHSSVVIELTQNYESTARNNSGRIYKMKRQIPELGGPILVNRVSPVKADGRTNAYVQSFTMKIRAVQSEGSLLTAGSEIIIFRRNQSFL